MNLLKSMEVFVQVVESASFSRAAAAMRLSPAMVSNRISQLESQVGVRLLSRTTRSFSLTDNGERYFAHCRRLLAEIAAVQSELAGPNSPPRGRLRLDVPANLGNWLIVPALPEFIERYPDVTIEVGFSDGVTLSRMDEWDIAVRFGPLKDSGLVARRIGSLRPVVAAAPTYLARNGVPATPQDLFRHRIINFILNRHQSILPLYFHDGVKTIELQVPGILAFSEHPPRIDAAIRGMGIIQALSPEVAVPIEAGQLKIVLREWEVPVAAVYLLYRKDTHLPAPVRAFVDHLLAWSARQSSNEIPTFVPSP